MKFLSLVFVALILSVGNTISWSKNFCKNRSLFPKTLMGQHYLPNQVYRKDIRAGSPGIPISLTITLVDLETCRPLRNVDVEIWHANSIGNYSSYKTWEEPPNPSLETRGTGGAVKEGSETDDEKHFLRGVQRTDAKGRVRFKTIFPGWIRGRTSHIHLNPKVYQKNHFGQLYFSELLKETLIQKEPYLNNPYYLTPNSRDCEFLCYNGAATVINLDKIGRNYYKASVLLGFQKQGKRNRRPQIPRKTPEYGVKCYKPDKLGRPHCKLINVPRSDGTVGEETLGLDVMES